MNPQSATHNPPSTSGRRYWRSLDELADTPEFREWLQREFPQGASEFTDDVSRRHFLKIMSASFALAGLGLMASGCRRPEEKLEPFGRQPEGYIYGEPEYYATAMPMRTGAIPLVVKSYEGRPIKIEGNAQFPGANGGTDRYAQASILDLYDPDRAKRFTHNGQTVSRAEALKLLDDLSAKFAANQGEGLAFLAESSTSPSRARLQKVIAQKFPKSQWFTCDAIDSGIHQRAATQAFGQPVKPVFHFDKAKIILSLDCDFLGGEDDSLNHIRRFAAGRKPGAGMSRLYAVESLFTLTGASADHRLRVAASLVGAIAAAIASGVSGTTASIPTGIDAKWISECAKDLNAAGKNTLVIAGQRQPLEVHLLAHAINSALGAIGNTVTLVPVQAMMGMNLQNFAPAAAETLIILGCNPVYSLDWSAKSKSKTVVRLGSHEDETFEICDWHFPEAHYLESWGDATTGDGTLVPIQPLIQPLFGGLTVLEFLARIAGETQKNPHDIIRTTFASSEEDWKKFLFCGFKADSAPQPVDLKLYSTFPGRLGAAPPSRDRLELIFYRDAKMDNGRYANNGWMQELPDPITKLTWGNAVLVSRKTARELGVQNGDVVEITLNGRSVKGPIWTQPGMADYSIGLALGYGRERAGRVGTGVGFNAYEIFSGKYIESGATVKNTGETHPLATTQDHWSMEGRPAVREANLAEFIKDPDFANEMHGVEPPIIAPLYPNPLDAAKKTALHQWGMAVDLNACVGCGTCVVACQSENNIPIVGKDQVRRGREMHWLRVERYYTADPAKEKASDAFLKDDEQQFAEWIDDVQAVNQPMMCHHCEAAPCENVCPVNATIHDQEGLNVMAYNRCIGTRYCSNNCPYKVRRFNYLDFNKRPLADLKGPFYPTPLTHKTDGKWDLLSWWKHPDASGMRPEDEWDLIRMVKNPDVTVRMRGVMEKCTYCTQRIEQAKIAQKVKAGASGDVRLTEAAGTVPKTACQQACPAGAIVFGDISDPDSTVSRLKAQQRNYSVLGELLTKPRTTYLARIRNPNPGMPDYHDWPYSFEEYEKRGGMFQGEKKGAG
ncbi:MAG TPA: TAT-variant-translocated molybdopterin oxidoreductase [Candidatus Acidoferrum sp.]|nr:TAT-variant-translocated molybdopterin oxidoreductase [Candidatus Acidoferrum sp.]